MTIRIDRSTVRESTAFYLDDARDNSKARRDRNRAAGFCINENAAGTHGKATHGVRCRRCCATHRGVAVEQVQA